MTTLAKYYERKAQGVCPVHPSIKVTEGHTYCGPCRQGMREAYMGQYPSPAMRDALDSAARNDLLSNSRTFQWKGPVFYHCGQEWPLTTLPFTAPCCGTVCFQE